MAGDTDIIAAIYDAIIEPSGWDEVVKRIESSRQQNRSAAAFIFNRRMRHICRQRAMSIHSMPTHTSSITTR
jgi:hypothetical protein